MPPILLPRPKDRTGLDIKNAPVRREMDVPEMSAGGADAFLFGGGVVGLLLGFCGADDHQRGIRDSYAWL
jgi:hypothetical protein